MKFGSKRAKKTAEEKRRIVFDVVLKGLLVVVSAFILFAAWYALYVSVMPMINSYLFGYAIGQTAFTEIESGVLPYTIVALWAIPALLLCATLNVLLFKGTKLWIKGACRLHGFMLKKFDEKIAKEKENKS